MYNLFPYQQVNICTSRPERNSSQLLWMLHSYFPVLNIICMSWVVHVQVSLCQLKMTKIILIKTNGPFFIHFTLYKEHYVLTLNHLSWYDMRLVRNILHVKPSFISFSGMLHKIDLTGRVTFVQGFTMFAVIWVSFLSIQFEKDKSRVTQKETWKKIHPWEAELDLLSFLSW